MYMLHVYVFNAYLDFFQQLFLNATLQFQVTVSLQTATGRTRSHACVQVLGTSTSPITLPNWQPFQRHDGCQEQPPMKHHSRQDDCELRTRQPGSQCSLRTLAEWLEPRSSKRRNSPWEAFRNNIPPGPSSFQKTPHAFVNLKFNAKSALLGEMSNMCSQGVNYAPFPSTNRRFMKH